MPPRSTHKMITAAGHIRRRTREEVRPKYVAAGQARGLLLLLQVKFGALPPGLVARVKRTRMKTLDGWCDRVLTAKSLVDVFVD
ncbi:MAG TPA: transposase [Planctomycetota bacterium]|nr:transposase [Planctomycetota bacterium]